MLHTLFHVCLLEHFPSLHLVTVCGNSQYFDIIGPEVR